MEPDYTKAVSDIAQCTYIQVRHTPLLIELKPTEPNYTESVSDIAQCTNSHSRHILANRKTTYSNCRQTYRSVYQTLQTEHTTPPEYIAWINNSQMTQITYTSLYQDLELLCNDSLQLCIYMTPSHILPPNAWKCHQDYFPSKPINSYPSMSSLVYYYTNILLSKNYFQMSPLYKQLRMH